MTFSAGRDRVRSLTGQEATLTTGGFLALRGDIQHGPNCEGELKIIAAILEAPLIKRILALVGAAGPRSAFTHSQTRFQSWHRARPGSGCSRLPQNTNVGHTNRPDPCYSAREVSDWKPHAQTTQK